MTHADAETQGTDLDDLEPVAEALADEVGATDTLDSLLAESLSLDDLLAESMESVQDAVAAKAARERLKRGGQSAVERAEDAARIAAWEVAHEWDAQANVALFHNYHCECGTGTSVFQGLFVREDHRTLSVSTRWRRTEAASAKLGNEVAVRDIKTLLCTECALGKGWDAETAYHWEG